MQDRSVELERRLQEQFKAAYRFTDDDLVANRQGTISKRQREQYKDTGKWFLRGTLIAMFAILLLLTLSLPSEGYSRLDSFGIGVLVAGLLGSMPLLAWWRTCHYPRGQGRVKSMVGPISHYDRSKVSVGKGLGGRELPPQERSHHWFYPPEGLMVRLYWNQGINKTLVHSIEIAEPDAESSMPARTRRARVWVVVLVLFLALVFVGGAIEQRREAREFQEQIDQLDLGPEPLEIPETDFSDFLEEPEIPEFRELPELPPLPESLDADGDGIIDDATVTVIEIE